jgi:hypothetical protein
MPRFSQGREPFIERWRKCYGWLLREAFFRCDSFRSQPLAQRLERKLLEFSPSNRAARLDSNIDRTLARFARWIGSNEEPLSSINSAPPTATNRRRGFF